MKKALLYFIVCLTVLVIVSCATTTKTFPIVYHHSPSTEFEILGTVSVRSTLNVGYNTILEEAKRRFPRTDFVIDIMIDEHEITISYHWFAMIFKYIFSANIKQQHTKYEYTISGTAIRYIRNTQQPNTSNNISVETVVPAITSVADNYTVASVNGLVQVQRYSGDTWSDVKVNDVLSKDFRIRTASNASLILYDRNNRLTIPGGVEGRLSSLIGMLIR